MAGVTNAVRPLASPQLKYWLTRIIMVSIRNLRESDLPAARVGRAAGWNQGVGLAADSVEPGLSWPFGRSRRHGLACTYGPVAWIAMVLWTKSAGGIGTVRHARHSPTNGAWTAFASTPRLSVNSVRTPGRAEYVLPRYAGVPIVPTCRASDIKPLAKIHRSRLELDRRVTGADRSKFLLRITAERPEGVRILHSEAGSGCSAQSRPS